MNSREYRLMSGASLEVMQAMRTLENRGLKFLVHFGTENAIARLNAMDRAFRDGTLYEHFQRDLGIVPEREAVYVRTRRRRENKG